jgi:arylsulfatase A-like enzyme
MPDRPNVLLLWTDQQNRGTLGAYGNDRIETPALDGLAATGTTFEHAYCTQPVCTPSRSAILTGRYPHRTGCLDNGLVLPRSERCLPEFSAFDEYATGHVGKWDLGDEVFSQHGFEEWAAVEDQYRAFYAKHHPWDARSAYGEFLADHGFEPDAESGFGEHPVDSPIFSRRFSAGLPEEYGKPGFVADEASAFIRRHRNEPFLLSVNFLEPHPPFRSPRDDQYDPAEIPLPPNFDHDGLNDQCDYLRTRREAIENGTGDSLDGVSTGLGERPTEADWRELVSRYWGLVSLVDTHVGRILRTLAECGLSEETIVVFTSDHGEHMGSHRLGGKRTMLEESAGIPLLVRVPWSDRNGSRVARPVSQIDLVPTLLEAAGGSPGDRFDGESWMPWFRGTGELPSRDVFVESQFVDVPDDVDRRVGRAEEYYGDEFTREVVTTYKRAIVSPDRMKYVYRPGDGDALYDLDADPYERRNLVDESAHAGTLRDLRERLRTAQERVDDPLSGPSPT